MGFDASILLESTFDAYSAFMDDQFSICVVEKDR